MPNCSPQTIAALISLLLLILSGCSSDSGNDNQPSGVDIPTVAGDLASSNAIDIPGGLSNASEAIEFEYSMDAVAGNSTTLASAQLFIPRSEAPAFGHPLVVWAHGTTGIANACTPSGSFDSFGNAVAIDSLLGAGYAVLAPDYEGFGTPTIHPYYVRSSHANSILDSVPAARKLPGNNLSDAWAVVGHSQGGHVALATARAEQLPAYPLQAVVALAPGTDLQPFSDRAFEAIDLAIANGNLEEAGNRTFYMNVYAAYVAHAINLVEPAFNPESLFGEAVRPLINEAVDETTCGTYPQSIAAALRQFVFGGGNVADFPGLRRDWYTDATIASRLDIEEMGDESQSMPLLIVQGDADQQVPVAATTAFVDRQRSLGTDVTYQIIPGGDHGIVGRAEFPRVLEWLQTRFPAN